MDAAYSSSSLPGGAMADWPTPNYENPERRTWMPGFILTWQIASTLLVSGRFYLRARKQAGSFGMDDVLVFLAWLFSIGLTASTWIDVVHFGLDRHAWDMKLEWAVGAAFYGWLGQVFFVCSTISTKLSVLLFHRRMINLIVDKRWVWAVRGALTFTSCYGVGVILAYMFTCQPLDALWNSYSGTYDKPFKCINGSEIAVTAGVLSVVSDLMAVALPCLMLNHYDLDVPRRQKIALNATFALALLATGAGIARSYYLWKIQHTTDPTWTGYNLFAWTVVECQLAIICACAPSMRVFFRRYFMESLKRTFDSVSHYAHGSRDRDHKESEEDFMTTTVLRTTNRDGRGFCELKELESGVHGITVPPPVIPAEEEGDYRLSQSSRARRATEDSVREDSVHCPTMAKVSDADEYETYAIERLSRRGTVVWEKARLVDCRSSKTESILCRFDDFVDYSGQNSKLNGDAM